MKSVHTAMRNILAVLVLSFSTEAHGGFIWPDLKPAEHNVETVPKIYGDVTAESAADAITAIHAANKQHTDAPIYFYLQSDGGSVMAGDAVIAAVRYSRRDVVTVAVGRCISMCVMIFEYGITRIVLPGAFLMIHNASMSLHGELPHIAGELGMVQRIWSEHEQCIAQRAGVSLDAYRAHEANQWWLNGTEAVHAGLADAVAEPSQYPVPSE